MEMLVHAQSEELLDGFKYGVDLRTPGLQYAQTVTPDAYWLRVRDPRAPKASPQVYCLTGLDGLTLTPHVTPPPSLLGYVNRLTF